MKKIHKTKLYVQREILRALQARELRGVNGGAALPETLIKCPPPPLTQDSVRACCA